MCALNARTNMAPSSTLLIFSLCIESLAPALERATEMSAKGVVWGDIHKIDIGHVLQRVPVLGSRYRLRTVAVPGSTQTVFKTSHDLTDEEHRTFFGAQARHVSDMADPDANWFILFGGQDGWLGSPAFADQVPMWRRGELIQVPLRPESVAASFRRITRLTRRTTPRWRRGRAE